MAGPVIGKVLVDWDPVDARWSIDPACRMAWEKLKAQMEKRAKDKPYQVSLSVLKVSHPRTLAQNRMMWALLTIMAREMNGGRVGDVAPEDCYIQMLEQYGSEFDYLELPSKAVPMLYNSYRVVKVVELLDQDRCVVKAGMGSSVFTTEQMRDLIDGIFDRLAEMGVNDPVVTEYWRDWHHGGN